jgi:hypothetical protein
MELIKHSSHLFVLVDVELILFRPARARFPRSLAMLQSKQAPLGFLRIDAYDKAAQTKRIAEAVKKHLPRPPPAPATKRSVGRPKQVRTANEALSAATAPAAAEVAEPEAKRARGSYTHWFSSPYINDILAAYRRTGCSAKRAIALLLAQAPDKRYARLSHSTINSWFDEQHQLLPRFQVQLDEGKAGARGGRPRIFAAAPEVEQKIKQTVLLMREAGTPVNCRIIAWTMRAVCTKMQPALLNSLTFSQPFVSAWAREQLQWRWRARTTTASKLPLDWEAQGMQMAMRVAANMEMHKVSHCGKLSTSRNTEEIQYLTRMASVFPLYSHRCIPLSSSTWTRLVCTLFPPLAGHMSSSTATALPSLVLRTRDRSLSASLLLLTANFCRFS